MAGNDSLHGSESEENKDKAERLPSPSNANTEESRAKVLSQAQRNSAQLKASLLSHSNKFASSNMKNLSRTQHSRSFLSPINEADDIYDKDIIQISNQARPKYTSLNKP